MIDPYGQVLLIDLENTVGSFQSHPDLLRRCLRALLGAAGQVHHAVASYAPANISSDHVGHILAELGIAPCPVPAGRDAADNALLRHARYVHERGGRRFTIVSGDHRFARLAQLGRLDVLVWEDQKVARILAKAAGDNLRRITRPRCKPGRDSRGSARGHIRPTIAV